MHTAGAVELNACGKGWKQPVNARLERLHGPKLGQGLHVGGQLWQVLHAQNRKRNIRLGLRDEMDLGGQALEHVMVGNLGDKDIQALRNTLVAGAVDWQGALIGWAEGAYPLNRALGSAWTVA
jgi:hypothetical protein